MEEPQNNEVDRLLMKLMMWYPKWFKKLEKRHLAALEYKKRYKAENGWKYRRKKK